MISHATPELRTLLRFNEPDGCWRGRLAQRSMDLAMRGDAAGPDPNMLQRAARLLGDFEALSRTLRSWLIEHPVMVHGDHLREPLSVRHSDEDIHFSFVALNFDVEGDALTFLTCHPDPYFLYRARLLDGEIHEVAGGFW